MRAGQVHVLVDQRAEQQRADVGEVHHRGDDQAAGEERREVPADRADQRVQRQAHRIAEDQRATRTGPWRARSRRRACCSSSSRLARITRVSRAVPATPRTTAGSQMCARRLRTRATLHGASTILRREEAGGADPEIGEGDPHEDQRQHEVRRRHADVVEDRDHVVERRTAGGWPSRSRPGSRPPR